LSEGLPSAVAVAVLEFLHGDLLRAPRRVGHELQRELLGTWSARRGSYRILYEIHDEVPDAFGEGTQEAGFVRIVDVDHRRDVYRRR
jgi:mRNA interferase RelE/StbE